MESLPYPSLYEGVVLITGGSQGIGLGTARVFCQAGANVVICARDAERGRRVAEEVAALGPGDCIFHRCDVAHTDQIAELVEWVVQRFGRLDCLVNNVAMPHHFRSIDEISVDEFKKVTNVNLVSVFATSKMALPHLRKSRGTIVNVGSITGLIGARRAPAYVTTKGALESLTRALAIDEAEHGVRVNIVLPGHIMVERRAEMEHRLPRGNEFHDAIEREQWMGRSGTPEEVGRVILFLASPAASYVTGVDLNVTGGKEIGSGPKADLSGLVASDGD